MSPERTSHNEQASTRRRIAAAGILAALVGSMAAKVDAGADTIDLRAAHPQADTLIPPWAPYPAITAADPAIPADIVDQIAHASMVMDVNVDDPASGGSETLDCGAGYVKTDSPNTGYSNVLLTASHCLASVGAERGPVIVTRETVASRLNAVTASPFPDRGAVPHQFSHDDITINNGRPSGDWIVTVSAGATDSLSITDRRGTFSFPYPAAKLAQGGLSMDEQVYVAPVAVTPAVFKGRVIGTRPGADGVPAVMVHFDPIGEIEPIRRGASGSPIFAVEDGQARVVGVLSGAQFDDNGTAEDAMISQDEVRRLAKGDQDSGSYGPLKLDAMPQVHSEGVISSAGFIPKNTMPTQRGNTRFQYTRPDYALVDRRRRRR